MGALYEQLNKDLQKGLGTIQIPVLTETSSHNITPPDILPAQFWFYIKQHSYELICYIYSHNYKALFTSSDFLYGSEVPATSTNFVR